MTVSIIQQVSAQSSGGSGADVAISSTPAAGDYVFVAILSSRSTARTISSVSGLGATWTEVHNSGTSRYVVYKGTGATSSGTVAIALSGTQVTLTSAWLVRGLATTTVSAAAFTTAASGTSLAGPSQSAGSGQVALASAITSGAATPITFPSAQTPTSAYTATTPASVSASAYAIPSSTASHQATVGGTASASYWVGQIVVGDVDSAPQVTASTSISVAGSASVVPVAFAAAASSATVSGSAASVVAAAATTAVTVATAAAVVAVVAVTGSSSVSVDSSASAYADGGSIPVTGDTGFTVGSSAAVVPVAVVDASTTASLASSASVVQVSPVTATTTVALASTADTVAVHAVDGATDVTVDSSATIDVVGTMFPIVLATFVDLYETTAWDGTSLSATAGAAYFTFPLYVDATGDGYAIEVDYTQVTGTPGGVYISSLLGTTEGEADASLWELLGSSTGLTGVGTTTITIGPGLMGWDTAIAAGELFLVFDVSELDITGIRTLPALEVAIPPGAVGTDSDNDAYKLTLGGWGVATWEPAVVLAPATDVRHAVISAIAYGPVTMQRTQPVFTYSEADRPRLRQRILLGGRDVTFDRDVPTPDVEYELADLLLYGPGTLDLPQYVAFAEVGTEPADRWAEGRRVKVQLVDDFTDPEHPSIEATIYKGFVMNPSMSGRNLSLELGGEAGGRLGLLDSHVLFRDVLDISRLLWRELTDAGVRYLPRLGGDGIGIKSLNFGGTGKLEKVEELLARAVKKDGTQRAVLPDADGAYAITDKDTETAHFTVFVDDAFTVADLSSDVAEKPNTIYATAIDPDGMRIDGAAVPGLISTPAPDYPMDDDSSFGEGTTNEDTDSGDGVSVMINRLGAVGLLDIRDTPGGFDEDVADALAKLQRKARLTGPVGVMTPALWRALWDLDVTGRSGRWSSIQPTAQDPLVQRYLRSASGAVIGLNPDFDQDALRVDESIDMGTGFRERQVQNWAETRVHTPGTKVWYGTITVNLGAVLAGQVDIGATITGEDLVDARLVQPGRHNLWVPNFDGGTLFGVSGVQVREGSVVFTVDTRFRPAREIWERLQVRRETRNDPARRMLGTRQSTQRKDAVRGFISWGGVIDRNRQLVPGWNVIEVVLGDYGTIARIETAVQTVSGTGGEVAIEGHEYALAVFGKSITADRLNALVPAPLAEDGGDRPWRRGASARYLRSRKRLYAVGTFAEPCGYGGDMKNDPGAILTGAHFDEGGFPYECEHYIGYLAVWVSEEATLLGGRVMWPLLEGGV